jgi:hypothetical protein
MRQDVCDTNSQDSALLSYVIYLYEDCIKRTINEGRITVAGMESILSGVFHVS